VSLSDTSYYHIVSRCVRQSYLCGEDLETGKNYEHRRDYIENLLRLISSVFCIEVCSYAIMSNHYHIVLHVKPNEVESLSNNEILERWTSLYKGPPIVQKYMKGEILEDFEVLALNGYIQ